MSRSSRVRWVQQLLKNTKLRPKRNESKQQPAQEKNKMMKQIFKEKTRYLTQSLLRWLAS